MNKTEINEKDQTSENITQFFTFLLGAETYGIEVNSVREVIEFKTVFKIPRIPKYIRGVINLRGEIVPVIDLSSRFYEDKQIDIKKTTCIVIIEIQDKTDGAFVHIGVAVDAIRAVTDIPDSLMEPPPSFGSNIRSDFIKGVGKVNDLFIFILNTDKVLDIEELADFA
jgi:purine-binding chemotaxis protein CheW